MIRFQLNKNKSREAHAFCDNIWFYLKTENIFLFAFWVVHKTAHFAKGKWEVSKREKFDID